MKIPKDLSFRPERSEASAVEEPAFLCTSAAAGVYH
jgi:hypothetical protein